MSRAARGELLGRSLELGQVVADPLEIVADLLARDVRLRARAVGARQRLAIAQARREVICGGARRLIRAVQAQHGAGGLGARGRELADVDRREVVFFEQRIGERFGEIGDQPAVLIAGERTDVDAEELRQLDQQVRGQRAAVGLDQVEVARRDAELVRELDLRQSFPAPQRPDLGAQPGLLGNALGRTRSGRPCH